MISQQEIYEHQPLAYYHTDHLLDNIHMFKAVDALPVLNIGCGRGRSVQQDGWYGVDFNRNLAAVWVDQGIADKCELADVKSLPFADDAFAWTVSMDFLEHVPPDDLDKAIAEILRVAPRFCHVIHAAPESVSRGPDGETLHPSGGLSADEWLSLFGNYGKDLSADVDGEFIRVSGRKYIVAG